MYMNKDIYIIFVISLGRSFLLGTIHEPAPPSNPVFLACDRPTESMAADAPCYLQPAKEISDILLIFVWDV